MTAVRLRSGERFPELPTDASSLRRTVQTVGAKLVIIDPLSAYLGSEINGFKDQDVRRALRPLTELAQATGAAVVIVRHLTKAAMGLAVTAGGGSIGIIGQARSALLVAKDPEDPQRGIVAVTKNNLSAFPPSLAYRICSGGAGRSRIEWTGESPRSAEDLIAAGRDNEERSATEEAAELLREWLRPGPQLKCELVTQARKAGITSRTLERAKTNLGVLHKKRGFGGESRTTWELPPA